MKFNADNIKMISKKPRTEKLLMFPMRNGEFIYVTKKMHRISVGGIHRMLECSGADCELCKSANKEILAIINKLTPFTIGKSSVEYAEMNRQRKDLYSQGVVKPAVKEQWILVAEVETDNKCVLYSGTNPKYHLRLLTLTENYTKGNLEPLYREAKMMGYHRKHFVCTLSINEHNPNKYYYDRVLERTHIKGNWYSKISKKLRYTRRIEKQVFNREMVVMPGMIENIVEASNRYVETMQLDNSCTGTM